MDSIYPDDRAMVMSIWNTLASGTPVTFEVRWIARAGSNDAAQWTLCACVPVFDDNNVVIGIGGNIIDINAQRRSQEVAQARVEALEQARLSEMKFARFAQLSPIAIYIYVPETGMYLWVLLYTFDIDWKLGMQYVNDQFFELTGHTRAPAEQIHWFDLIADEDLESVEEDWADMLKGKRTEGIQFRLKKTWIDQEGVRSNTWVQSSSHPETDEQGNIISMT
jgi:PAS domain-containing protein